MGKEKGKELKIEDPTTLKFKIKKFFKEKIFNDPVLIPVPDEYVDFNFEQASPGMPDLMRRLYLVNVNSTMDDPEQYQRKLKQEKDQYKGMDKFEIKKVSILKLINETDAMLQNFEKDRRNFRLKKGIKDNLKKITTIQEEMKKLEEKIRNKKGIFTNKKIQQELVEQRERDNEVVKAHVDRLYKIDRKIVMNGRGGSKKEEERRDFTKQKTNMQDIISQDIPPIEELPKIDISDGLKQIAQNKQLQEEYLNQIEVQLDELKEMAKNMTTELDKQDKILELMTKDVLKYEQKLHSTNSRLQSVMDKTSKINPFRAMLLIVVFMLILGGLLLGYLIIQKKVIN